MSNECYVVIKQNGPERAKTFTSYYKRKKIYRSKDIYPQKV